MALTRPKRKPRKPRKPEPEVDWNAVIKFLDEAAGKLRQAAAKASKGKPEDATLGRDLKLLAEESLDLQQHAQSLKLRTEAEAEGGNANS